jgi:hypothetical protein
MFRTVLVALIAVFALTAIAASSALASPEWYVKKAGVFKKVTTAVKVEFEASKLAMIYNLGGGYEGMSCTTSTFGHGTVEAAGVGKIEAFRAGRPEENCQGGKIKENSEGNVCTEHGIEEMTAINTPWTTQLSAEGTSIRMGISQSPLPGFKFKCKTIGGTQILVSCEGNTSARAFNNATAGLVEDEFESKSPRTTCAKEKEKGEWKGTLKVKPSKAENEAGIEAVKAE